MFAQIRTKMFLNIQLQPDRIVFITHLCAYLMCGGTAWIQVVVPKKTPHQKHIHADEPEKPPKPNKEREGAKQSRNDNDDIHMR